LQMAAAYQHQIHTLRLLPHTLDRACSAPNSFDYNPPAETRTA
jgi:hypothetical protein